MLAPSSTVPHASAPHSFSQGEFRMRMPKDSMRLLHRPFRRLLPVGRRSVLAAAAGAGAAIALGAASGTARAATSVTPRDARSG